MNIPTDLLKDKKILLGVTGSIAIYKSLELIRLFTKAGAEVKVVMSSASQKFVTPLTFETLSSNRVLDDTNESWADEHNHIKVAEWADIFLIAPATANTIAKLANAIADNMLLEVALAFPAKKILAPSANTNMIQNPITQANMKMLAIANYSIIETQTKELACKTTGDGAMAEPLDIFYATARELLKEEFWEDRMVIVTGGGTIEKIDEVRYISNFSSGKMASSLSTALYLRGADVNLIATRFDTKLPKNMHKIEVESSEEMQEYLVDSIRIAKKGKLSKPSLMSDEHIHRIEKKPYLFMAAAVSDYLPAFAQEGKLKKDILGEEWELKLKANRDILASLDKSGITTVGFKAEMDEQNALSNATKMLEQKELNGVCLNLLKNSSSFGSERNAIEFITKDGVESLPSDEKLALSLKILSASSKL
jgi:phosphopantothenoylcysteine decarboxylase/phosphopantothenate--cysteine ligase